MVDLQKLKSLLDEIVSDPSLAANKDESGNIVTTHCNQAVIKVLNGFDYHTLDGKMANEMCEYITNAEEWIELNGTQAQKAVNKGGLLIAYHPYQEHGHVAMLAPGSMVMSGHWAVLCPLVANVGKTQGYMGANEAFPVTSTPPKYAMLMQ